MTSCKIMQYFKKNFSAKIFLIFSILIIIISLSFTLFFFRYQSRTLTNQTVRKGQLLVSLLAHSSKLGVFSENADLLNGPINGIMENPDVLSAAVFTAEGKRIAFRKRAGNCLRNPDAGLQGMMRHPARSLFFRDKDTFVFWERLVLSSDVAKEDALYFDDQSLRENEQVIGFVKLTLDGRPLQKTLHGVLLDSVLIGLVFLFMGSVFAYVTAGRVTKPLNRLIDGVNALGMGKEHQEIDVETDDEVGNLAAAFNSMAESLKRREAEKCDLQEQLRQSQKMEAIGTLAGGVAHDFNNILTVISAYDSLLKRNLDEGDKLWSYADHIEKEVQKAAALTHRLLAFCRRQVINPKAIKLNEIVTHLEKILALLITEEIDLHLHLDPADPVVLADSGQLDHVIVNLVTNARDAMPHGGSLTIKTGIVSDEADFTSPHRQGNYGSYAFVSVTDSGVGMTDEIKERIFDPFFTTKEVGKGTGLGLSMAYGIVQQHNGKIEVHSEPGKGTCFRLYLPITREVVIERQEKTRPVMQTSSATILVAEDDKAVMAALKGILHDNGYNVIDAVDGEDAIRKFVEHKERIQLALLDVIMPRKNGRQVYDEIIKVKPGLKTIFLSGYTNDMISCKGILDEGIQLITKPVRVEELLQKLKEVLEVKTPV